MKREMLALPHCTTLYVVANVPVIYRRLQVTERLFVFDRIQAPLPRWIRLHNLAPIGYEVIGLCNISRK